MFRARFARGLLREPKALTWPCSPGTAFHGGTLPFHRRAGHCTLVGLVVRPLSIPARHRMDDLRGTKQFENWV